METKSSHSSSFVSRPSDSVFDPRHIIAPSIYNIRPCPCCGASIYGMPGGRDAQCASCGYKDPCCSD